MNYEEQKTRFNKMFANLPLVERKMPIFHSQEWGTINWLVLKFEVEQNTKVAVGALKSLTNSGII